MVRPHDCGAAGASTPPSSPRPLLAVALLLLLLPGCKREAIDKVPTMGVEYCKVRVGEVRPNVLLKCGPGCGGGDTPTGRCDVYRYVLICYGADQRVASLRRLGSQNDTFKWCRW